MLKSKSLSIIVLALSLTTLLAAGCEKKENTLERPLGNEQGSSSDPNTKSGEVAGRIVTLPTKKITVANQELEVELAASDKDKAQGLSGRTNLEEGSGMLFDFSSDSDSKKPGFWMKDMFISIDIIWINNEKIIGIEENIPLPPEDSDLPVYYPPSEITHVLEVPAGWSKKNNIVVGEVVTL